MIKAKVTINEYEEQEVSIRALDVLPEMLQVRADLDKGWSREYSKGYARGDALPPILVYRLPDDRLVVSDGFHRIDACLAIGKKSIRAQIREGTMHDALLAAIEANMAAFHRGRPFGEPDKKHSAMLMFGDPECWLWCDKLIADRCGSYSATVMKWRAEYATARSIDLPKKVLDAGGRFIVYKRKKQHDSPRIRVNSIGKGVNQYRAQVDREEINLGTDEGKAREKLDEFMKEREERKNLLERGQLERFLGHRGFLFEGIQRSSPTAYPGIFGRVGHGAVITVVRFDRGDTVPWAIGCLLMIRELAEEPDARMVAVCFPTDGSQSSIKLARKLGFEFLTPDELVASLKGDA